MSIVPSSPPADTVIVLKTARMYLRRFTAEDDGLLCELDADPEVMRFISKGKPTPLKVIQEEILPRVLSYYSRPGEQGCWAAHLGKTGEFVGWFHLRADKLEPAEMELGYRLKRSVWRKGLATEGAIALVEKGFSEWGSWKICARTLAGNAASRRVMEKCGLKFEREFFYPAEMLPEWTADERRAVKYSAAADDWCLATQREKKS